MSSSEEAPIIFCSEKHPFRLFVYAEMEHKMERCKKRAPESEHFTDKD